jgi:hypothetical protein
VGFTDALPAGLTVSNPNGLTSSCNGTAIATPGTGNISLGAGSISPSGSCTIAVSVTASSTDGIYTNVTSHVISSEGGTGNAASAIITVAHPPSISKAFSALAIPAGGSVTLIFKIANPNTVVSFTGVAFIDTLPTNLSVSTPNGLIGSCGGGVITAAAGGTTISLTGASLAPGASCTFSVNVTAGATGTFVNVTDPVTSDQTVPGNTASATVTAGSVFEVSYSANLNLGDAFVNVTNTGENGAQIDGPGFGPPTGNLCINVYALGADEELLSCCSCLVTPNALSSLSVRSDLVFNPSSPGVQNSVVIKLVSTLAGGSGAGTSCTNSAAFSGTLASGLAAWGTTLHASPSGIEAVTENPFLPTVLSAEELASLTNRCAFIIGNASGAGICNSCRTGGLGAVRQQ